MKNEKGNANSHILADKHSAMAVHILHKLHNEKPPNTVANTLRDCTYAMKCPSGKMKASLHNHRLCPESPRN
jgi:hypothetical protein